MIKLTSFWILINDQFIHKQIHFIIVSFNLVAGCDILKPICHFRSSFAHQNGGPVTNQKINKGSRLQLDLYDKINFILDSY